MGIVVPIFSVRKLCVFPPLTSFTSVSHQPCSIILLKVSSCGLAPRGLPGKSGAFPALLPSCAHPRDILRSWVLWHPCKLRMSKPLELMFPCKRPLHLNSLLYCESTDQDWETTQPAVPPRTLFTTLLPLP